MTRVSVIIPCYNAGEDLRNAILSVLHQSYSNIELIIQDAQSDDTTTQSILCEFRDSCSIFVEKDNGIFDAFQKGIDKSSGEWIYLMGADDQLANENVIEKLMQYDFSYQYEIMCGKVMNVESKSHWIPLTFNSAFDTRIYFRNTLHQQGCLYRKKIFSLFPFESKFKILGDYHLHLQLYKQKIKALETPLTFAVCKADGLSKQFEWTMYREEIALKKELLPWYVFPIFAMLTVMKCWIKKIAPRKKMI